MFKNLNSLQDFDKAFPDEQSCIDHFRAVRWPHGVACVHCGSMDRIYDLKMGKHKCGDCKGKFTVRNGSIFEDSKLPLNLWFKAIFLMTSMKKGIASHRLQELLGVSQKTAWFVLHRIRDASDTKEFNEPLTGTVEIDEAYVGGQGKWKHANKKSGRSGPQAGSKKAMFGMLQRDGELRFRHISSVRDVKSEVTQNIVPGSTIYTDDGAHYNWMKSGMYRHDLVKHCYKEYARGSVTTNRIEGAFGHFKRAVHGVYHQISDEHLERYLDMFTWRWNRRDLKAGDRVNELLESAAKHRLTYKQLMRKMD